MTQKKQKIIHLSIAAGLVLAGIIGFAVILSSKSSIKKAIPETPLPLVRTISVTTGSHTVILSGQGTVRPVQEIQMVPEVSGKVVEVSPALVNGGSFKKGDILLRIDPVDYNIAVTLAEALVKDAESRFKQAQEESSAARDEWTQLHPGSDPPPLVAKEPQLAASRAKLDAEKANLKKARIQLDRTMLIAPFDGRVSSEHVDVGQYVSPGQPLAELYATDAAEIILPMEDNDLLWFHVPGFTSEREKGSPATVTASVAGSRLSWPGRVVRSEGKLNEKTRMINIVVRVEKPYAEKPPLAAGLFVNVSIQGRTIENAVVIPRAALRDDQFIWVVSTDGILEFRKVGVARYSVDGVIIEEGVSDGEMVVVSSIKSVSDGMRVRYVTIAEENKS